METAKHNAIKDMKALFRKYDDNNDGTITRKELAAILRKVGKGLPENKIRQLVNMADKNRNKVIEYDEFLDLLFMQGDDAECEIPEPYGVSESGCRALWMVWRLLVRQEGDTRVEPTVSKQTVLKSLEGPLSPVMKEARQMFNDEDADADVNASGSRLFEYLLSGETQDSFLEGPDKISSAIFVEKVWPALSQNDAQRVVCLFRKYFAQQQLSTVFQKVIHNVPAELDVENIKYMFDEIDVDGDGFLSIKELVQIGQLSLKDAATLHEQLQGSASSDGALDLKELMAVFGLDNAVSEHLKGLFARS